MTNTNRPARARPDEGVDWLSLAIACLASMALVALAFALYLAWPLL